MNNVLVPVTTVAPIDISGAIESAVTLITSQISTNLPLILGAAGTLMAVGIVWGFFKRFLPKK